MIAMRDKTAPQVAAFHRHWAADGQRRAAHWWNVDHDTTKYPLYSAAAKTADAAELDNFFAEVAFTNGSFKDLLLSNVGFVNKDNAGIYGLSNSGTALTKVELDPVQRPGFLTRAGFLSSYSHYDSTAPILRGAFITVYMIGVDPGPPIPGAFMIMPPTGNYTTNRERTEALDESVGELPGVPHQHHQSSRFRAGELRRHREVADDRSRSVGQSTPAATVNFGDGNIEGDHQRPAADAGDRRDPKGTVAVRAEPGLLCLRTGAERERSLRRRPDRRQAGRRRLHHPRCCSPISPRRIPSACASVLREGERSDHDRANANEPKNLPPGPGRGGRRRAVSQLARRARRRRGRRPASRNS